ncbi:MAG: aldehyde ferredoxin oxidoreductase [Bacteroidetes bacterium]|nr:aldehyde ferredoxin oxidoreductase [Bacteroidota bacterium]MCL5026795.1 aldehyde ferredoxin oxidoreductase [Chloroflexota bacterium]
MSRILRVNMTDLKAKFEEVPQKYNLLGGRGLTSTIVADEVPPTCHPLGPSNKLVLAPGLVTGTTAPSSGRLSVGGKSPLTGGIKEANAGGLAGQKLARLGIKAIIVEGQPKDDKLYLLRVDRNGAKLSSARGIAGRGMYEVDRLLGERYPGAGIIGIGPAGEMRMAMAGVSVNDPENRPGRYAGRGGLGAVMGAKGLKAIIVDDTGGPGVEVRNPGMLRTEARKLADALTTHAVTGTALPTYGTSVLINIMNEAGGLPTRNFSSGRFEGASKVSGEMINELATKVRKGEGRVGHACHPGCVIRCSNIFPNPDGTHHVSCMEYESVWALGPDCGIDNLDDIADLVWLCNDIGVDTIEAGATLAVAMEAGLARFGDGAGAIKLLKEVGKGSPLGHIIGGGAAFTGKAFGVTRVPTVKGQAMPAYEPRAVKGIGVTYATSVMGADHTSGYTIAPEILSVGGKADPFDVNKAELSRAFQYTTAFIDSTGYCLFIAFAILDIASGFDGMYGTVNGVFGTSLTADDVVKIGEQIVKTERRFNQLAGLGAASDRIPEFMKLEKLPPHNTVWDVPDAELDKVHA